MNTSLKDIINNRIKTEAITPTPRWVYTLQYAGMVIGVIIATVIGGIVFGLLIEVIARHDVMMLEHLEESDVVWLIILLPLLWIMVGSVAVGLMTLLWRHTPRGHRTRSSIVVGSSVLMSVVIGLITYMTGTAAYIDQEAVPRAPFLRAAMEQEIRIWNQPENGRLIGVIVVDEVATTEQPESTDTLPLHTNCCKMRDPLGKIWQIYLPEAAELLITDRTDREIGVKLIGTSVAEQEFRADKVHIWRAPPKNDLPPPMRERIEQEKSNREQ